ncbi:hypothetical protein LZ30DRAFT_190185 [Colletotrichum cereale]|nr:hypothetical protein LZ30DRAFT_190185 [Colletotrichum cereale]
MQTSLRRTAASHGHRLANGGVEVEKWNRDGGVHTHKTVQSIAHHSYCFLFKQLEISPPPPGMTYCRIRQVHAVQDYNWPRPPSAPSRPSQCLPAGSGRERENGVACWLEGRKLLQNAWASPCVIWFRPNKTPGANAVEHACDEGDLHAGVFDRDHGLASEPCVRSQRLIYPRIVTISLSSFPSVTDLSDLGR